MKGIKKTWIVIAYFIFLIIYVSFLFVWIKVLINIPCPHFSYQVIGDHVGFYHDFEKCSSFINGLSLWIISFSITILTILFIMVILRYLLIKKKNDILPKETEKFNEILLTKT